MLQKFYQNWVKMKPLKFIFTTVFIGFMSMITIGIILFLIGVDSDEIGKLDYTKFSVAYLFLLAVVIAPIIETFIGQILPIKLIQYLFKNKSEIISILFSAIIFSLMHISYSIWYSILIFPLAFLLAKTYVIFQKRKESSYWMTTAVHALHNLIAITIGVLSTL